MKKKILSFLLFLFLLLPRAASAQGVVSGSAFLKNQPKKEEDLDIRLLLLNSFLKKKGSPLADYSADFIRVADEQGLDWRLLPAIAGLESSYGKRLIQSSFNPFGWGGGYIYFEDWANGFEKVARGLNRGPYPESKSPLALGPVYAPPNPKWGYLVSNIMNQISPSSL